MTSRSEGEEKGGATNRWSWKFPKRGSKSKGKGLHSLEAMLGEYAGGKSGGGHADAYYWNTWSLGAYSVTPEDNRFDGLEVSDDPMCGRCIPEGPSVLDIMKLAELEGIPYEQAKAEMEDF